MAGQRERGFKATPDFKGPNVNPAATMRTDGAQAVAAQVRGQGSALNALGGAMSSFFGTVAKTAEQINEIETRESLVEIERQRKARAVQAQADHANGRPRDTSLDIYQDYKGAYDVAVADESASKISADLQTAMRNLPNTPDTNLTQFATEFVQEQMKGGTGDPAIDGRMAFAVKQRADQLIAHKTEQIAQTSEANIAQTITKGLTRKMMEQGGVTTEQTDSFYSEALGLAKGDIAKADKLFTHALTQAIYNPGHANSTLAALRESGFAQRNPGVYLDITEKAWAQTNRVKSVAAGQEVQEVSGGYLAASAAYRNLGGIMPAEEYLGWIRRASDVHMRHGVGMHSFPWVTGDLDAHAAARKDLKDTASVNEIIQAYQGQGGGDVRRVLSNGEAKEEEFGKVMSKKFIPALNGIMEVMGDNFPALQAAGDPRGGFDFLATRESAKDFAKLLGSKPAAFGYAVDDNTSARFSNAIMGGNPEQAIIAVDGLTALQNTPGGQMFVNNILKDPAARARLDVIQNRARDSGGLENAVRLVTSDKTTEDREGKEIKDGRIDWRRATRDPEVKEQDTLNAIDEKARDVFLDGQDRSHWYSRNPKANLHPALQDKMYRLTSRHMYEQQSNLPLGSKPDLDKATKWAADQIKGDSVPLTAQNGVLRYVPDPYAGKGRQYKDPIAIYNGRKVYAGMKLDNRFGQEEDPQKTFTSVDRPALAKKFAGFLGNPSDAGEEADIYLMPPDQKTGLMPVMTNGQRPLAFYAGMPVRIDGKDLKVPASPAEADTFFRTHMPPGFQVIKGAPDSQGRNTYRAAYGYRVVGDDDAFAKAGADRAYERQEEIKQIKAAMDPVTGAVQNQRTPIAHPNYRRN